MEYPKSNAYMLLVASLFVNSIFATLLPIQSWAGYKAKVGTQLPPALIGKWQVVKVLVDSGATRKLDYQYDDPAVKGRIFTISQDKLTPGTLEEISCKNPTITQKRTTAADLIKHSMAGRGVEPQIPTPKDYGLPLAANKLVDVLTAHCGKQDVWAGDLGPVDGIEGAWIVVLSSGQLAIRWYGETILILKSLPANAKPEPSFNCQKAKTPVEKAICESIELASFDLSVAESYKQNIKGFTEAKDISAVKRVKECQKAWLKKRDACGANATCLKKSMMKQLEVLGDLEKFYSPI